MIQFDNVGMRYGLGPEVLKNISFTLPPGSFHFLTGPSGAGKTTLLRLILLSLRPTRGLIHLFDRDTSILRRRELPDIRRRLGVVFQDFRLLDHLSIYENIALPLRIMGRPESEFHVDIKELLDWVDLTDQMHMNPPTLSGGEKQRAAIARAVVAQPDILLADEPTGNVDPAMAERLLRLFIELNRFGATVLVATHNQSLINHFDAPCLVLDQGEITLQNGAAA